MSTNEVVAGAIAIATGATTTSVGVVAASARAVVGIFG